jgi:4-hydroxythreonine-4-phosphate dehydrogenase
MTGDERPILGISVGDPGGIGPEVSAKALAQEEVYRICRPLLVADARVVEDVLGFTRLPLDVRRVSSPREGLYCYGTLDVLHLQNMPHHRIRYKQVTAEQGQASFEYVVRVIQLALKREIHAAVTGPINKAAINAAGHAFAGHTEIFAHYTGTSDYAMMLAHEDFRVVHVSTHVSLREACDRVKKDRVLRVIRLTQEALIRLGLPNPRIGVAGLNPHCGEEGLFGWEDLEEILPAVQEAQRAGLQVEGPIPPDTIFPRMRGGMFDAVVVMYHDQGHIPMKLLGFNYNRQTGQWEAMAGVNVTLGLPIIRTSVDHGTAFGKAGEGRANPQSMLEAIRMAATLARNTWREEIVGSG